MRKIKTPKITDIEESKLQFQKVIGEGINQQGQRVIKVQWETANGELNLGSCKEPNREIRQIKYTFPVNPEKSPFGMFFGGDK